MTIPKAVCVYCGSSSNTRASHQAAARAFGTLLAERNITLVFGGGRVGLMGIVADAALAAGGRVTGVIPRFLMAREVGHSGCSELHVTETMHDRKRKMAELSDGFAILPGGLGTLDEAFEIITWKQLGLHDKPVVFANIDGYWNSLEALFDNLVDEHYVPRKHRSLIRMVRSVDDLLPALSTSPEGRVELDSKWI